MLRRLKHEYDTISEQYTIDKQDNTWYVFKEAYIIEIKIAKNYPFRVFDANILLNIDKNTHTKQVLYKLPLSYDIIDNHLTNRINLYTYDIKYFAHKINDKTLFYKIEEYFDKFTPHNTIYEFLQIIQNPLKC